MGALPEQARGSGGFTGVVAVSILVLLAGSLLIMPETYMSAVANVATTAVGAIGFAGEAANHPAPTVPEVPGFFDLEAYRFYNPEVANLTEAEAKQHYVQVGRQEGRICRRLPLFLSYIAFGGLCNQFFSHVMGLSLAYAVKATALTQHAFDRPTFDSQGGDPGFRPQPIETILDFKAWTGYWKKQGVPILKSANTTECVYIDLSNPGDHYHLTKDLGEGVFVGYTKRPNYTLPEAAARLATHYISGAVQPMLAADPAAAPCVNVYLANPGTILDLPKSQPYLPRITPEAFPFAPEVVRAANTILGIIAKNHTTFLGVHLRIESDWVTRLVKGATKKNPIGAYINTMSDANFTNTSAVYFASGIFGYDEDAVAELKWKLNMFGTCGSMYYKLALLPPETLAGFHSEQLALIDLLVLSRAERYVGDPRSSFSIFLREYRLLKGLPRESFHPIGNETYMEATTRFAKAP